MPARDIKDSPPSAPDACAAPPSFSLPRFAFFTVVFLVMMLGGILLVALSDSRFGIQFASIVTYTAAVILYTFSSNRGMQRYLFGCPYVRRKLPLLALLHVGFLAALFLMETGALDIRLRLPDYWLEASGRSKSPFTVVLAVLCVALFLTQILTNRSLLSRAHIQTGLD